MAQATDETKNNVNLVNLANSEVLLPNGSSKKLGLVWKDKTTVLVFLRHFACIACRAHAKQVWEQRDKYQMSGSKIVFVGNGQPHFIEKFKESMGMKDAEIYTDPSLKSYKAAGFHYGFFYVVQPDSVLNMVRLYKDGYRQTGTSKHVGTHWQLGGIIVVKPEGRVTYQYISESVGDFPDETLEIIQADEKATK